MKEIYSKLWSIFIIMLLLCGIFFVTSMFVVPAKAEVIPYEVIQAYTCGGIRPFGGYYMSVPPGGYCSGTPTYAGPNVAAVQTPSGYVLRMDADYIAEKGDLTTKKTDLSISGRGIDLVIERVYSSPAVWYENGTPCGYENPLVNIGKGWSLNFPWVGNLLHLRDGVCFEIKWSGNVFENHQQGIHFKLVKQADNTYSLYKPSGITYHFDAAGKLKIIEDNNGNKISFAYGNGLLCNITDTVGRVVYFLYSESKLSQIFYDGMTVDYTYSNGALTKVKDVQGRYFYYSYSYSHDYWLLTKTTFPEGGYKTYSYTNFSSVIDGSIYQKYKIASEKLYDGSSNLINEKVYSYIGNFSIITSSTTTVKDGNGAKKIKQTFIMDSEGRVESFQSLDMANMQTIGYSESHSATQKGINGNGYWEGEYFYAYYIYFIGDDWVEGYVPVGPFEHYPGTPGYISYERSVSGPTTLPTITVTTHWAVTTIPQLRKCLYTYNVRNEIVREDVYVGDTGQLSYSLFRRYDDWGNLVYSKDSIGHERFFSYANTENDGVFIDYYGNPKTGFSNLFYSNHVQSNIQSLLVGRAEFQDSETTIEEYKKYDFKGNEIESRTILCGKTSYLQFSGTFDESSSTSFPIDLTGVSVQGNAMLKITGLPKQDYVQKTESHSGYHKGVDGTGYWQGKYFKAHYLCIWGGDGWEIDEGYINVGPFEHYPGTAGYKRYTTSVYSGHTITVTTYYDVIVDRYPTKVDYDLNGADWKTIVDNLGLDTKIESVIPFEFNAGMNTLYFRESSSYSTKFYWELYVPIYNPPKEDLQVQCTRDGYGNVISFIDAEGAATLYEYGSEYNHAYRTKTVCTVDGYNITSSYTYYFARGLAASVTDPNGCFTIFEYDNLGRVVKVTNPDGSQRITTYNDIDNVVTYYDELGNFGKVYYDGLGRLVKKERYLEDEIYSVETFTYNYDSQIVSKTLPHEPGAPNPPLYTFEYDVQSRQIKSTGPDGAYSAKIYDDINNIVTFIDAEQHRTECKYSWTGRLLWVKEYYDSSSYYLTQYEYDEMGDLVKTVDANNQATICEFGSLFGITKRVYPDSAYEQIAYNEVGSVIWTVNRNGENTTYTYDEIHRRIQTTYADGTTRNFSYDNCSRLISTARREYSSTYQYDCRGRVTWESHVIRGGGPESYNILFTYDVANRVTKMTYPDGSEICYEYDSLGRVTKIYSGEYIFATFGYNFDNTLDFITYGNQLQTTYTYDTRLRPVNISTVDPNQGNLEMLSLSFTYDNVSNIKQLVNGRRTPSGTWMESTENYDYDWLNRLISAHGSFGDIQYSYDSMGNRITETENGVTIAYQYDNCNRLISYQSDSANATFTYDNMGSLKARTVNNETCYYIYNVENRLVEVVKGQLLGSYSYDANGRRVYQLEGSKTTTTVYSGVNPIHEHIVESARHTLYNYIYGPTGRIARKSDDQVVYYHMDHLGSTRLVTNSSAAIVTTISYMPFGEKAEVYGTEESFTFNGKEEDSQTGLYYYGARYYDPQLGRFTQPDVYFGAASDPQSHNRYVYCRNNPLAYVDRTGHAVNKANSYNWQDQVAADEEACEQSLENFYKEQKDAETKKALEELNKESQISGLRHLADLFASGLVNRKDAIKAFMLVKNTYIAMVDAGIYPEDGLYGFYQAAGKALSPVSTGISQGLRAAQDYPGPTLTGAAVAGTAAAINQAAKCAIGAIPLVGPVLLVGNSLAGDPLGEGCYIIAQTAVEPVADLVTYTFEAPVNPSDPWYCGHNWPGSGGGPNGSIC